MDPHDPKPAKPGATFESPTPDDPSSETVTLDGAAVARSRLISPGSSHYLQPGTLLGQRYEILQLLGQGGMGAVYKAKDLELDRLVALKVIRPDLAGEPNLLQRFKHELILARQIAHRNVIRIFDLGEADGIKFISMEYVEGENLASLLAKHGKFAPSEAAEIIYQVFRALEAAHEENVVHRDLKPHNVMRNPHGKILVMDFGLARSAEVSALTRSGALVGTLEYMAPEQAQGQQVDARSDIYSAGLIFYELLTGKMPFDSESAVASLIKRSQERVVPPIKIDPTIPKPLNDIVVRCLEIDPKNRYHNVQQVIQELNAWGDFSVSETSVFVPFKGISRKQRVWRWIGACAFALLLVAAGVGIYKLLHSENVATHKPVTLLVADFNNRTGDPVFDGTLEPSFSLALEGAPFISAYNRGAARKIGGQIKPGTSTLDEALARLVAVREGINVVVEGNVSRAGEGYKIAASAVDSVTGNVIASSDADASSKEAVLRGVSKLAARVRRALGDSTPESVQLAQAETFSANSLEAAHEYGQAQEMQLTGNWPEAIDHYTRALGFDGDLGRAYVGLANAYHNTGQPDKARHYYELALSKIDRMSDREKYRTRGAYYLLTRDTEKAIEQQLQLVQAYPADVAGLSNLALAYFYRRDMAKALELGREGLKIYPNNVIHRNNVGLYAMYAGDFETAVREQQKVLDLNDKFVLGYVGTALSQLAQGKVEGAKQTYKKLEGLGAQAASASAAGLADVALYEGSLDDAVLILQNGAAQDAASKNSDGQARKLALLANAHVLVGKKADALSAARAAAPLSSDIGTQFFVARAFIEAGQPKAGLAIAVQLQQKLESDPQAYGKLIEAEAAISRGDARAALKLIQDSRHLADTWMGRFDEARALLLVRAYAEAESALDFCMKRRGEATALFLDESPTYFLFPPVYYYLGRAQEGLKSPAAAESYRTFLKFKDKGKGERLVADARSRIAQR